MPTKKQTTEQPPKRATRKPTAKSTPSKMPRVLASKTLQQDLERHREDALSGLEVLEAELLAIEEKANRDMQMIKEKAEAEYNSRIKERDDLEKVVEMVEKGLGMTPKGKESNQHVASALADQRMKEQIENATLEEQEREKQYLEDEVRESLN